MKKCCELSCFARRRWKKITRAMKLTITLILFAVLAATAGSSYSQTTRINLKVKDATLEDVFREIERTSEFGFFFKSEELDMGKHVSIDMENASIEEILKKVLDNEYSYRILDKNIVVTRTNVNPVEQQQKTVSGNVTDSSGIGLPGVSVVVKGTTTGVITDSEGKYSLSSVPANATLQFSFVGMKTQEIAVGNKSLINVTLEEETIGLEEVVAVGYGTVKKSDLTGSVSSVSSKELVKANNVNIQSAIQGRATGVMVSSNSGAPGSEATIRVRGIGTVNNNNPIYVVDGMVIDNSDPTNPASNINFLNPSDIASIEVLKDASAQAIYGSRGANGVILITTHKGGETAPKITLSSTLGITNVSRIAELMDAPEYLDYVLKANYNGYMRSVPNADPNIDPKTLNNMTKTAVAQYNKGINTDWLGEILRSNVISQNHNFSITGGSKLAHYSASAGMINEDGLITNSSFKRNSFRLNTDYKIGKYITIGENLGISISKKRGLSEGLVGPISQAMLIDPVSPVLRPEGEVLATDPYYQYNKYSPSTLGATGNPVGTIAMSNLLNTNLTLVGNLFAEATLLKNFKFRSSFGFNIANTEVSDFAPKYYISALWQNTLSVVTANNYRSNGWILENTLNYNKTIKDHSITALVGYTSEYTKATTLSASKQGTPNNDPEMQTFDAATTQPSITGTYNILSMISYLGRVNYSFKNKYLLTASVRRDGSSKFGNGHKWGTFPSFSLGWRLSDEQFFKNLNSGLISSVKLRSGWGQIGNSSLPVYNAYISQIQSIASYKYAFNEAAAAGYFLKTIGTPDVSWETTEQTNFGMDISILKSSLSLSADYFIKNTDNMLLQVPTVAYSGYPSTAVPYTNAGSVRNKGIEVVVSYQGKSGDFNYGVSVNGTVFKNEVMSLGLGNKPIISSQNRTEVGSSIGRFYGWVTDGIFQTEAEVKNYKGPNGTVLQPNAHAGDFRFKNLNNDESITADDETWIGNPLPDLTYGVNINLGYKAFDLVAFFQGSYGNDIYNATLTRMGTLAGEYNGYKYVYENAWRGEGTSNTQPLMTTVNANDNYRISDYYVEDGSYLRLKNLQVGYNFPKAICKKCKFENARIWVGGTDLITFTNYSGNDPEVGLVSTPTSGAGTDNFAPYPKSRKISVGINVSF